jgi:hypothetical protein
MTQVGLLLVCDLEQARTLPIKNLPSGTRRIRLRQTRSKYPVYFFVRLPDGIITYVGSLVDQGKAIELVKRMNGSAFSKTLQGGS